MRPRPDRLSHCACTGRFNDHSDRCKNLITCLFFFSSRRRHTRFDCDWSSDVCSSDLDIYSQVIWGSQISLIVGIFSAMVASVLGTAVGLISGYMGGWVDELMMRFNDVVLSIPWLVLMIVVAPRIGTIDLLGLILVIGLTGWSITARVILAQDLSVKERLFVERARMIGSSPSHILLRHIFPNAFPPIFANTLPTVSGP